MMNRISFHAKLAPDVHREISPARPAAQPPQDQFILVANSKATAVQPSRQCAPSLNQELQDIIKLIPKGAISEELDDQTKSKIWGILNWAMNSRSDGERYRFMRELTSARPLVVDLFCDAADPFLFPVVGCGTPFVGFCAFYFSSLPPPPCPATTPTPKNQFVPTRTGHQNQEGGVLRLTPEGVVPVRPDHQTQKKIREAVKKTP